MTAPPLGRWRRYVAVGDSFTEGLNDEHPDRPGSYLGWADRLADRLAASHGPDFGAVGYANLAIRGRLLGQITADQVPAALALAPDLVSLVGGANDLLRPRADVDAMAVLLEGAVGRIRATGADVLLATQVDPRGALLFDRLRGRYATFSCHVHSIAIRHGCHLLDLWGLAGLRDRRMWAEDRLHLSPSGHHLVAQAAARALELHLQPTPEPEPGEAGDLPPRQATSGAARVGEHARWAGSYLAPWIGRRLTGRSSGDTVSAKRPHLSHPDD